MDSPTESSVSHSETEEDLPPILRLSDGLLKEIALCLESSPTYTQDLLSLSLTCSQIGVVAISALWFDPTRHIYRGKYNPRINKRNWTRFEALVERLKQCPTLGEATRELYFLAEITFFGAQAFDFSWLPTHDETVIALLDACPNLDTVAVTAWRGRQGGRHRFKWLDSLRDRDNLDRLVVKLVHPGLKPHLLSFVDPELPPSVAVTFNGFEQNLDDWSAVPFDCPNLEHLHLALVSLPSALPVGLLPNSLESLVIVPSHLNITSVKIKRLAFEDWARNSTNLVLSLPLLPNLIKLRIARGWLSTEAFLVFASNAPKLEELNLRRAEWYDEGVCEGNGQQRARPLRSVPTAVVAFHNADAPILRLPDDLLDAVCQQFLKTPPSHGQMRYSSDGPLASTYEDDRPTPPFLRLPDELLDKIAFPLLATPSYAEDLISLTRVCRRLSAAAVRTLFWDPSLPLYRGKLEEEADERNWERLEALVRRLKEEPSLGLHARKLHHLGEVTYFKASSMNKWTHACDEPIIALLEACPNITEIHTSPFFGRARIGDKFRWLDRLHDCKRLEDIKLRQVQSGTEIWLMPFLSVVKLPPTARVTLLRFDMPFAQLSRWGKAASVSTKHLTFEDCDITGAKGWSSLPLAAPNLEHLHLQLGTLPDSLPPGLLPSTLRTLDIEPGFSTKKGPIDRSAMTTWLDHPSPLICSLPSLPNLVRLHFVSACLTTDALLALPDIAPKLAELLFPGAMYEDDEVVSGDGDEVFLDLVSSFRHLSRLDLGIVQLRSNDHDELSLTKEYCMLNRIELTYKRDDFDEPDWTSDDDSEGDSE
ncbi:hypothetical protein JCM10021v2_001307 [Rhodotorula toruloides]